MTDLVIRPLQAGEVELFGSLSDPGLVGMASTGRKFPELLAKREYRPEWTWIALRDGEVVARAAWWGGPKDAAPVLLDWYDFTERDAGVRLLRTAPLRTDFCLILPPNWREQPVVRHAAESRIGAARDAGMRPFVERLRYTWTAAHGVPPDPDRLEYRPEPDDAVILDVLRRVHSVTLDAHARRASGPEAAARDELSFLRWMPSPREWWRLAYTRSGDLVGISVPGRNYGGPIIGFIGVVPEHRGHGYGYDLLVAATRLLTGAAHTEVAQAEAAQIVAGTDVTNLPMAAAFARAGYPVTQQQVYLMW